MIGFLVDLFVWVLEKLSCKETKPVYATQKTNFEVAKTEQGATPAIPVAEEEKQVETPVVLLPPSPPEEQPVEQNLTDATELTGKQKRRRRARPTKKKAKKH